MRSLAVHAPLAAAQALIRVVTDQQLTDLLSTGCKYFKGTNSMPSPASLPGLDEMQAPAVRYCRLFVGSLAFVFAAGPANAEVIEVRMERVSYSPPQISAQVGDTVEWVNNDIVAHTASARNGEWDVTLLPQQKKTIVLKAAGSFEYYCKFHPNMVGQITVR